MWKLKQTAAMFYFWQLLLNGKDRIDIKDWMRNTRLKHCRPDSVVVKWFWKAVKQFNVDQRKRLLQFVTGSCRLPIQGFRSLRGKISRLSGADSSKSSNIFTDFIFPLTLTDKTNMYCWTFYLHVSYIAWTIGRCNVET